MEARSPCERSRSGPSFCNFLSCAQRRWAYALTKMKFLCDCSPPPPPSISPDFTPTLYLRSKENWKHQRPCSNFYLFNSLRAWGTVTTMPPFSPFSSSSPVLFSYAHTILHALLITFLLPSLSPPPSVTLFPVFSCIFSRRTWKEDLMIFYSILNYFILKRNLEKVNFVLETPFPLSWTQVYTKIGFLNYMAVTLKVKKTKPVGIVVWWACCFLLRKTISGNTY